MSDQSEANQTRALQTGQNESDGTPVFRVAIVGGGLAGLAAAVGLADRGLQVELIESRRNLGGRTTSFRDPATGTLVDHCQHVSLGCCTNLADFYRRTGLDRFMRRDRTLYFFGPQGERCQLSGKSWLPAPLHLLPSLLRLNYLSWRERVGIVRAMRQLARASAADDPAGPTIDRWLREHGQTDRAIELFWTPVIVSALSESLDRAGVAPVRKVFVDGFLAAQEAFEMEVPQVPLGELYGERLENWLSQHGIRVRRDCPVKLLRGDISSTGNTLVREVALDGVETESYDAVILAVPWRRVGELLDQPLRSALTELQALDQFESAPISGVHLWFDRPICDVPHAVLPGRLSQWLFYRGPYDLPQNDGKPITSHYYQVVISASRDVAALGRDAAINQVHRELSLLWRAAREAKLLQSKLVTEQHAVFSVRPGVERLRPPTRSSVQNLFLAGDWTATGWPATMEGAVRSGYLAAEAVLERANRPAKLLRPDLPRSWLARRVIGS